MVSLRSLKNAYALKFTFKKTTPQNLKNKKFTFSVFKILLQLRTPNFPILKMLSLRYYIKNKKDVFRFTPNHFFIFAIISPFPKIIKLKVVIPYLLHIFSKPFFRYTTKPLQKNTP